MKSAQSISLFTALVSMTVLAQFSRAPVVNQLNGLPAAQQRNPALPPSVPQMTQGGRFGHREAGAFESSVRRRGPLPGQGGLDFAMPKNTPANCDK